MADPRRILFSAQKNEGPFLLEWIAYHKAIGFTDIIIFSNDCDDGSDALLDRLAAAGEIIHHIQTVPEGIAPQTHAATVAQDMGLFHDGDWVMWLDLDEFLFLPRGAHRLDDLFAAAPDFDVMTFAWRFYGDSGNATWPGRHISPAFTRCEPRHAVRNPQVKTLFRYGPHIARLDIHRPVLAPNVTADDLTCRTSEGQPVAPEFFAPKRRPFNRMPGTRRPFRHGMVMHFSIRTPDMYAEKTRRGDGYYANKDEIVRNDVFYRKKNKNHVADRDHLVMEAPTVAEMERLRDLPGVQAALDGIRLFKWMPIETPAGETGSP